MGEKGEESREKEGKRREEQRRGGGGGGRGGGGRALLLLLCLGHCTTTPKSSVTLRTQDKLNLNPCQIQSCLRVTASIRWLTPLLHVPRDLALCTPRAPCSLPCLHIRSRDAVSISTHNTLYSWPCKQILLFKDLLYSFSYVYICAHSMCMFIHMCRCPQRPAEGTGSPGVGVQAAVSHPLCRVLCKSSTCS